MSRHQEPATPGRKGALCRKTDGTPCPNAPMLGSVGKICRAHMVSPAARANAAMRAAVAPFAPDDAPPVDAAMLLLRMVSYAAEQQRYYAGLLARKHAALGENATLDEEIDLATFSTYGEGGKSGEQVRALVRWEAHWVDKVVEYTTKALAAGIAERQVRLAEQQGALFVEALKAFALALGHDWDGTTRELASRALLTIEGSTE